MVTLSQYKLYITLFAFLMIVIAGYINYKTYYMPCPADPELGRACSETRKKSRYLYYASRSNFFIRYNFYIYSSEVFIKMKHPCHKEQLTSLKRIEGQVRGVQGMIEEGKYCVDILNQIKALKNSIITVEGKILKTHLRECIKESLKGDDEFDIKIDEIMKTMKR